MGSDGLCSSNPCLLAVILENGEEKGHLGPAQVIIQAQGTSMTKLETLSISRLSEAEGTEWRTMMTVVCRRLSL